MAEFGDYCMNCMESMQGKDVCPVCGFHRNQPQRAGALPYGTLLQNRYLIGRAKKSNGEGINYIGLDTALNIPASIHEFYPSSLAGRGQDGKAVCILGGSEIAFNECRSAFLNYSRELAHMRELSAIVLVYDIFEENDTAYTVSEWNDNITLRYFVKRSGGNIGWNAARQLFMPVLSALSTLHANGISHLGISPDTLQIMKDGRMKLGSFSIAAVRQMDTDLPPDLVPGCAAIEQYIMGDTPTEATDVYGFAASLFFALTGSLPPEAPRRRSDARLLIPNSVMRSLPPYLIAALANALQVAPERRTPTFERLRAELSSAPAVTAAIEASQRFERISSPPPREGKKPRKNEKRVPGFVWVLSSCLIMLAVFAVIGWFWMHSSGEESQLSTARAAASVSSQPTSAVASVQSDPDAGKITVPNLVGQSYDDLMADASAMTSGKQQYQILLSKQQFSDTLAQGLVISQDPKPGTKMTNGSAIVIIVSEGPALRALPAVAGKTLSQASATVTAAGFVPSKTEAYSDTVPKGTVIGYQNAKEGNQMAYGSKVVLVVSLGRGSNSSNSSALSSTP